jgi:hypothetical protein
MIARTHRLCAMIVIPSFVRRPRADIAIALEPAVNPRSGVAVVGVGLDVIASSRRDASEE